MAVAVDANFIRWSFNSHVTTLECNLLGNVVSHRIEIDRSWVHDQEYGGSLIVSISDRAERRIKPLLVRFTADCLAAVTFNTYLVYEPDIHSARLSNFQWIIEDWNLITIVESHIGLFSRVFPFVELIIEGAYSSILSRHLSLPFLFSFLYFFSLLSFSSISRGYVAFPTVLREIIS